MRANLNAEQRKAVEHGSGPLLVLAGAGSGKTRVITHRIARLIERGVEPEAILAVSFTNKAAFEMRSRMRALVGDRVAERLRLSTFHSFGVGFLQEERRRERFVIFDQGDSMGLVREILRQMRRASGRRRLDPAAIATRISLWKNQFVGPEDVRASDVEYDAAAREVYPRYEAALRAMSAVDFDDLVVVPARMLRDDAALSAKWRRRLKHLLVDEFQDTNRAQLELVRLLANEQRNVCVVGDDDQAIYGWRGADVANILEFEAHFAGATVVTLEDNYRSRAPILAVANAAIAQSRGPRHPKTLRSARGGGEPVRLSVVADPTEEAKLVAAEIATLRKEGTRFAAIAVLYRSNLQTRPVEEELRAAGLPYRVFGGTQFFDRKEIKDAAAYLRVALNPRDEISLRRILNFPARGIGEATVERIARAARATKRSFAEVLAGIDQIDDVPDAARLGAAELLSALDRARARLRQGPRLTETAKALFDEVGLTRELGDAEENGARRSDNLAFFVRAIARYEAREDVAKPTLAEFLLRITLAPETEDDDPGNAVTLSTLHGAKGLEFDVVFLIGCVEGQLPHGRTTDPKLSDAAPTDVEEERRLFYVGVTRARERLYLTRARRRLKNGKPTALAPSRFLEGLPAEHVETYEFKAQEPIQAEELAEMTRAFLAQLAGRA